MAELLELSGTPHFPMPMGDLGSDGLILKGPDGRVKEMIGSNIGVFVADLVLEASGHQPGKNAIVDLAFAGASGIAAVTSARAMLDSDIIEPVRFISGGLMVLMGLSAVGGVLFAIDAAKAKVTRPTKIIKTLTA